MIRKMYQIQCVIHIPTVTKVTMCNTYTYGNQGIIHINSTTGVGFRVRVKVRTVLYVHHTYITRKTIYRVIQV